jgi:hypothetical protein
MDLADLWKAYLARQALRTVPSYDASAYDELRLAAYEKVFGGSAPSVMMEPIPTPPFLVTVHVFDPPDPQGMPVIIMPGASPTIAPRSKRTATTLVTLGMSNERMDVDAAASDAWPRVELAIYLDKQVVTWNPDLVHFAGDLLLHHAKQPFLEEKPLAPGMILPIHVLAQGQVSFLGDRGISSLLVVPAPDDALHQHLELDGDPVRLLALVPIKPEEERYIRAWGAEGFHAMAKLPVIYGGPRRALVTDVTIPPPHVEPDAKEPARDDATAAGPGSKPGSAEKPWWRFW